MIRVLKGRGEIDDDQRQVGVRHRSVAALDAKILHQVLSLPDTRRVYELDRNAIKGSGLGNQIASGSRNIGNDCAILFEEPVEEAALAHVWASYDCHVESVVHELPVSEAGNQSGGGSEDWFQAAQDLLGRSDAEIVLCEIDAGFEKGDQLE